MITPSGEVKRFEERRSDRLVDLIDGLMPHLIQSFICLRSWWEKRCGLPEAHVRSLLVLFRRVFCSQFCRCSNSCFMELSTQGGLYLTTEKLHRWRLQNGSWKTTIDWRARCGEAGGVFRIGEKAARILFEWSYLPWSRSTAPPPEMISRGFRLPLRRNLTPSSTSTTMPQKNTSSLAAQATRPMIYKTNTLFPW